jgi:hypothetical protein
LQTPIRKRVALKLAQIVVRRFSFGLKFGVKFGLVPAERAAAAENSMNLVADLDKAVEFDGCQNRRVGTRRFSLSAS